MKTKLKFDAVIVTLIVMLLVIVVILAIESPKPEESEQAGQGFKGTYVLGQQESDDAEYYVIMDQQGCVFTDFIRMIWIWWSENTEKPTETVSRCWMMSRILLRL